MSFTSAVFLWQFMPAVCVANFFLPTNISNIFLLLASLVFYAWGEPVLILLLLLSVVVNGLVGGGIYSNKTLAKPLLAAGVVFNAAMLVYYKYAGFLVGLIMPGVQLPRIALPIGISFFTFKAISFLGDIYKGKIQNKPTLLDAALYISFFPQVVNGPIAQYRYFEKQIHNRKATIDNLSVGFRRFVYGMAKKIIISNSLGQCADTIYGLDIMEINGRMAWLASICYAFQLYYDFAGYSDMAIGLSNMLGFGVKENFDYPYMSKSIKEFWRRWHISLGNWFKEYVYFPLGGNRKGVARTYFNLSAVFLLTGLWHGANYTFILWGIYHGFFNIAERLCLDKILKKSKILAHSYLLLVVNFGWVFFRIPDLALALKLIKRMLMPWMYSHLGTPILFHLDFKVVLILFCAVLGCGIIQKFCPEKLKNRWKFSLPETVFCALLMVLCLASIASNAYNPFIYAQF